MENVIIDKGNRRFESLKLETFIKDYGITPKCQGKNFYILGKDETDSYIIQKFPNKACAFLDGRIQYIIYKGPMQMIVNGMAVPPCDFIDESQVLASEEDCYAMIEQLEKELKGKITHIDCPDGRRIKL